MFKLFIETKGLNFLITLNALQWEGLQSMARLFGAKAGTPDFGKCALDMVKLGLVTSFRATHESREKVFGKIKEHYPDLTVLDKRGPNDAD